MNGSQYVTLGLTIRERRFYAAHMDVRRKADKPGKAAGRASDWPQVLPHRSADPDGMQRAAARFENNGIRPLQVQRVLADGGDALFSAAVSDEPDWTAAFGGPVAVALLASEVGVLAAHLSSRASGVRSLAVDLLLEDYSAVSVAAELGVSRQKVYEIARAGLRPPYLTQVPWRTAR